MTGSIFDRLETPAAARLLGWRLISEDPANGSIEVGFEAGPAFANPAGVVQGGLLAAMLDDTLGPAILVASGGRRYGQTIDLHTHFLRPVPFGPVRGVGRVTKMGGSVAFLEGELYDRDGRLCARATASALLVDLPGGAG